MKRSLVFDGVSFAYEKPSNVFTELDFMVRGGLTLLLGPNGAGKTTLLRLAAGVEQPDGGRIELNGLDLWCDEVESRRDLAYVPQEPEVTPFATVLDVLRLVCRLRSEPARRAADLLRELDLEHTAELSVRQLSRGQQRTVLLAAAWIGSPRTVFLDEPFDAMDDAMRARVTEWIARLKREHGLVVVAAHEVDAWLDSADRILVLRGGTIRQIETLPPSRRERRQFVNGLTHPIGNSAS